jgi:hypothetical protein
MVRIFSGPAKVFPPTRCASGTMLTAPMHPGKLRRGRWTGARIALFGLTNSKRGPKLFMRLPDQVSLFAGHAIIVSMEVGNIRLYKDRWHAVEEIERQELRAMTASEHWQKLNAIVRFALETGMEIEEDHGEMEVFQRWAKLKSHYEA